MNKTINNRAWFLVLPVFILVAFNALIPLMTVVNYSIQETFGNNVFLWSGTTWFQQILHDTNFHDSLKRQIIFTGLVLLIQVPLGLVIALCMPRKGPWV
ncbi:MAG: sugar ABC transporter permease, partial [Alphaproteobacteria bacterium]|nr:sugar ABC transporter permease [Alphaproteobacteria bacterium]